MKTIAKFILTFAVCLALWNYLSDLYLASVERPIHKHILVLEEKPSDKELINVVAEKLKDELGNQIVIASPQRISPLSIAQMYFDLPREDWGWVDYFRLNFDLINYFYRKLTKIAPYGGFILYDYNIGNYSFQQYRDYTSYLRKIYRIEVEIIFEDNLQKKMTMNIYPWVVADCAIMLVDKPYCRNFRVKKLSKDIKLSELYSNIGLNSPLAPVIDKIDAQTTCSQKYPILQDIVSDMYSSKQLPVLKHFLYTPEIMDAHLGNYRDGRSIEDIIRDAECYSVVDNIGIPYAIMPSHFYFDTIDEQNINTRSDKFQSFIRQNFPNAYTISDEISMKGYARNENFADRVSSNSSDMLLVHGGTIKFWKRKQILKGVKQIDEYLLTEKIKRVLELKEAYGLVEVHN